MTTAWFLTLGAMLIIYALLDGIDLGIGAVHLLIARTDAERRALFSVIGPFWFGYEVWLIASGGAMVAAFPVLYADSFSGFYLVLTVVLWLLIGRGTAIEFRSRVEDRLWRGLWDVVFSAASILLALFFGAAFANVFRGVPLDSHHEFEGTFALALNPYAIVVGTLSVVLMSIHGAGYASLRLADSALRRRALEICRYLLWPLVPLTILAAILGLQERPQALVNFAHWPILIVVPVIGTIGFAIVILSVLRCHSRGIVTGTAMLILGLMGVAGVSLYPSLLPVLGEATGGLTIFNAAVPRVDLISALAAALVSLTAVIVYAAYEHFVFRAPVEVTSEEMAH